MRQKSNSLKEGKRKPNNKIYKNKDIQEVIVFEKHPRLSAILKWIGVCTAVASLIISIVSLCVSCSLQSEINSFTENMSNLNYNLTISETPEKISQKDFLMQNSDKNDIYYTISPFIISKNKSKYSGDFEKYYFATVNDDEIDISEITSDYIGKFYNNGCLIDMIDNSDKDNFKFFYSPGIENNWSIIHIIIKGYNGENNYFTLVCNCENDKREVDSILLSKENLYNRDKIKEYIDTSALKITVNELIIKIENERKLLFEKLD